MGAEVPAMIVRNHGAERHELKAPQEAVVHRKPVLGLTLVLQARRRESAMSVHDQCNASECTPKPDELQCANALVFVLSEESNASSP